MTGYAVVEKTWNDQSYRFYLSAVNGRFFELKWRLPRTFQNFEHPGKKLLKDTLKRGSFNLWIETVGESDKALSLKNYFNKLEQSLNEVKDSSVPNSDKIQILSRNSDLWWESKQCNSGDFKEFQNILNALGSELQKSRVQEGEKTQEDLTKHLGQIKTSIATITSNEAQTRQHWMDQYKQRISELGDMMKTELPEERFLQESLALCEKRDINEECQRVQSHLSAIDDLFAKVPDNFGKRLEFFVQELHREWTTLGNKIRHVELSQAIIEAKLSIEKLREQCLNLL